MYMSCLTLYFKYFPLSFAANQVSFKSLTPAASSVQKFKALPQTHTHTHTRQGKAKQILNYFFKACPTLAKVQRKKRKQKIS